MKRFEFALSDSLYEQSLLPIRTKYDILILLAHTIKFLVSSPLSQQTPEENSRKMILYIDKMSRLLFCVKNKIFTFQFPLQVQIPSDGNDCLSVYYGDFLKIDSIVSSLLLAVFEQKDIFKGSLENIDQKVLQEIVDNEWDDINWDGLCELIKHLVLFEPGYLRYDHDIKHANGELHPEHHLDFFFSQNNVLKIGLRSGVESEWMLDLLNILTNCKYIT
ncbi:hypothetical protein ACVS9P_02360 [Caproicibacterium sp. NSD3]